MAWNKGIPEQWKRYKDTKYFVSDFGRIKKETKDGSLKPVKQKTETCWGKAKQITTRINGDRKRVKNIVWETFMGDIPKGYFVVNKNRLYNDNSLYNLILLKENELSSYFFKNRKTVKYVVNLDNGNVYFGTEEASKKIYCSRRTISNICNGITKNPCVNVAWWDIENEKAYRGNYIYSYE